MLIIYSCVHLLHLDGLGLFCRLTLAVVDLANDELGNCAEHKEEATNKANVVRRFANGSESPVGGWQRLIERGFLNESVSSLH